MIDFDNLFKQNAFDCIEKEKLELFKQFAQNIKGKNLEEIFFDIVTFFNSIPKDKSLTQAEREAIIKAVIQEIPEHEQKKFANILNIIKNF